MHRSLALALAFCLLFAGSLSAQSKAAKGKSPGDVAAEEYFKVREAKDIPPTPARFAEIINLGLSFLAQYPTHSRANAVISSLGNFSATMRDKKLETLRASWLAQLQYEVIRQGGDTLGQEAQAAFKAAAAAAAGGAARDRGSRENMAAFREKIDRLAEMPEAARFLTAQEKAYVEVLKIASPADAEKQVRKLLTHPDQKVANMARDELNLMEMRKQPLELKFTALDGREIDVAQFRGKVLYIVFWATSHEASTQELAELKDVFSTYQKQGLEIIAVAQDKAADREALVKYVKDRRVAWPVLFDGAGNKGELSVKLNARTLPASALFNQKGLLVNTGVRSAKLGAEVKKLLDVK